jgi:hypothetical protein
MLIGRLFMIWTPTFVPVRGGGRIVKEVHDGWVEGLVLFNVHARRLWTVI